MPNRIKRLIKLLFLLILVTISLHLLPATLEIDMSLPDLIAILISFIDIVLVMKEYKTEIEKRNECLFFFSVDNNYFLNFDDYHRQDCEIKHTFLFWHKTKVEGLDEPFYGMEFVLQENPLCGVGLPLCMEVKTKLETQAIQFLNVKVCTDKNDKLEYSTLSTGSEISKLINGQIKFLVKMQLLCDISEEEKLKNCNYILSFTLSLTDADQEIHKKYIILRILYASVEGQDSITVTKQKTYNNWLPYVMDKKKNYKSI